MYESTLYLWRVTFCGGDILDSHDLSWHCELLIFPKNNFQSGKKLLCFECFQHSAFYGCSIHESRPHSAVGENKSDLPLIHTLPLLPKSTNLQIGCIQIPIAFPSPSCHLHQKADILKFPEELPCN